MTTMIYTTPKKPVINEQSLDYIQFKEIVYFIIYLVAKLQ